MKNKRIIAFAKKSRVNKKIRRILVNKNRIVKKNTERERAIYVKKKRVNVEFLKCVFYYHFDFFFFFFLTN